MAADMNDDSREQVFEQALDGRSAVDKAFEWYTKPAPGVGSLSQRRALAWLASVSALVKSKRLSYGGTASAAILERARELALSEELPEWTSVDAAVAHLEDILDRAASSGADST